MSRMDDENRLDLKPEPQHLLQHEFSTVVFLDFLCERPWELIYQEKTLHQYQANIIGELISTRPEIRESWIDNKVEDSINQILDKTENIARENGFTQSLRKQSMKYLLPLMIGLLVGSFVIIFFLGDIFGEEYFWMMYVIYAVLILAMCLIPRYINMRLLNRWRIFGEEHGPTIKKYITSVVDRIHKFIQFLIDDIRKILTQNNLDLANYRLMLFNPNYDNVKILQEQVQKSVKFYIMELLPVDTEAVEAESPASADSEEHIDDEFRGYSA